MSDELKEAMIAPVYEVSILPGITDKLVGANHHAALKSEVERLTEREKVLLDALRPFVEAIPHEKDHGRTGHPKTWCERCRFDAILNGGES